MEGVIDLMRYFTLNRARRLWSFLTDPGVEIWPKLVALLIVAYILSPVDLLPGLPPISGLDDLLLGLLGWWSLNATMDYHSKASDQDQD